MSNGFIRHHVVAERSCSASPVLFLVFLLTRMVAFLHDGVSTAKYLDAKKDGSRV